MKSHRFSLDTGRAARVVDITAEIERFVRSEGDGLLNVSVPHATAGIAVMELGSGSEEDLIERIEALLPREEIYSHSHGSKGHGADHILPAFIAPALTLPVLAGKVSLGTWQRIAVVDTNRDNPRREVLLAFLAGS